MTDTAGSIWLAIELSLVVTLVARWALTLGDLRAPAATHIPVWRRAFEGAPAGILAVAAMLALRTLHADALPPAGPTCLDRGWFPDHTEVICAPRALPLLRLGGALALGVHHALCGVVGAALPHRLRPPALLANGCVGALCAAGLLWIGQVYVGPNFFGFPGFATWESALVGGAVSATGAEAGAVALVVALGAGVVRRLRRRG